jgi:hypothetical protein
MPPGGANNITNWPAFRSQGSGFGTNHVAGDYRLLAGSPCINTGSNLTWMSDSADAGSRDFLGAARIINTTVDRGAYEYSGLLALGTNLAVIDDGSSVISVANGTDFGVEFIGGFAVRTFTITNSGSESLTLGEAAIGGGAATDFSVIAQPSSPVAAGDTTTMQIQFDALEAGARSAVVYLTNSAAGQSPYTFSIGGTAAKIPALVTLQNLSQTYDGAPREASAETDPFGLMVDFTYDGNAWAPTNVGSYAVTGVINDAVYEGSATGTLSVSKGTAGVYLQGLSQTYDGTAKNVTATTDPSGLTVEFTYDGNAWAPTNAGSYAVTGTVNDANWAGEAGGTLAVAKAAQTITNFPNPGAQETTNRVTLSAQAASGLACAFSVVEGPGVLAGDELTFTNSGTVAVVAGQAGDANWNPAADATNSFSVSKAIAQVTLNDLSQTYDGTPRVVSVVTVPADLAVLLTYDGDTNPPLNSGSYSVTGAVQEAMYQGEATGALWVAKAVAGVYLAGLNQTYDGTAKSVTATTDPAGLTVEFTYDGNAWAPTNAGSCSVTGTVAEANYAGSTHDTLEIEKASQTISDFLPVNGTTFVETNAAGLSAAASSGLPVAFAVSEGPGLIAEETNLSFTGRGLVSVAASQPGNANWNPAPALTNVYTALGLFDLIIESAHGVAVPPTGTYAWVEGTILTNAISGEDTQGATQYICAGWSLAGNDPAGGASTQMVMTVTNDATLSWLWTTNYWLATAAGPHGSVNVEDGWQPFGVTTQIAATAETYYHFSAWTGDVSESDISSNPVSVWMNSPKSVLANFAANMTSNSPVPVPDPWLAEYGLTNFEEDVNLDADHDGQWTWQEYIAMTDPTNPHAYFRAQMDHGSVLVSWPSASGRVYDVQSMLFLSDDHWTAVAMWTNLPATPPMNTVTSPAGLLTNEILFFRTGVRLE